MKFTPEQERILLDENAYPVDRANAIWCMRRDGVQKHEDLIVSFLDHASCELRGHAVLILLRWGKQEYLSIALDWFVNDPEESLRKQIALSLGECAHAFPQHRETIIRTLVERVECDPDEDVVRCAYLGARRALDAPHQSFQLDAFDRQRDVDWKLLAPYRRSDPQKSSNKRS